VPHSRDAVARGEGHALAGNWSAHAKAHVKITHDWSACDDALARHGQASDHGSKVNHAYARAHARLYDAPDDQDANVKAPDDARAVHGHALEFARAYQEASHAPAHRVANQASLHGSTDKAHQASHHGSTNKANRGVHAQADARAGDVAHANASARHRKAFRRRHDCGLHNAEHVALIHSQPGFAYSSHDAASVCGAQQCEPSVAVAVIRVTVIAPSVVVHGADGEPIVVHGADGEPFARTCCVAVIKPVILGPVAERVVLGPVAEPVVHRTVAEPVVHRTVAKPVVEPRKFSASLTPIDFEFKCTLRASLLLLF